MRKTKDNNLIVYEVVVNISNLKELLRRGFISERDLILTHILRDKDMILNSSGKKWKITSFMPRKADSYKENANPTTKTSS